MYLVDTNVWLERLLDQERSAEVQRFLEAIPSDQLFMTDFTDDAYQYVAAEENDLILMSFDTDFDQTKLGKKTPVEVLKQPRK